MLNSETTDYTGGGTYFKSIDCRASAPAGTAIVFSGHLLHAGVEIDSGQRVSFPQHPSECRPLLLDILAQLCIIVDHFDPHHIATCSPVLIHQYLLVGFGATGAGQAMAGAAGQRP